jgi:hypothetical protein
VDAPVMYPLAVPMKLYPLPLSERQYPTPVSEPQYPLPPRGAQTPAAVATGPAAPAAVNADGSSRSAAAVPPTGDPVRDVAVRGLVDITA